MHGKAIYRLVLAGCITGLAWILLHYFIPTATGTSGVVVCPIKNLSGYPCPSCGTTRALILLLKGDPLSSAGVNPLGLILGPLLIILPLVAVFDLFTGNRSLYKAYRGAEEIVRRPPVAILLSVLILLNWVWNIKKEL